MINVKLYLNNKISYISLEDYLDEYHSKLTPAWNKYLEWVNEGMNINTKEGYIVYTKKLNLKWWNTKMVCNHYQSLKNSNLAQLFDDDILKFIAHLYGLGYFERIGNPELNDWLNTKGVFKPNHENIPDNEKYSLMDLVPFKNGTNAIKRELLLALKW
tara:strand:- start:56 stop:529 length:474 start_codon:yes stop_codon:yes gene_type:complete